jgi:hypothetical protein
VQTCGSLKLLSRTTTVSRLRAELLLPKSNEAEIGVPAPSATPEC